MAADEWIRSVQRWLCVQEGRCHRGHQEGQLIRREQSGCLPSNSTIVLSSALQVCSIASPGKGEGPRCRPDTQPGYRRVDGVLCRPSASMSELCVTSFGATPSARIVSTSRSASAKFAPCCCFAATLTSAEYRCTSAATPPAWAIERITQARPASDPAFAQCVSTHNSGCTRISSSAAARTSTAARDHSMAAPRCHSRSGSVNTSRRNSSATPALACPSSAARCR